MGVWLRLVRFKKQSGSMGAFVRTHVVDQQSKDREMMERMDGCTLSCMFRGFEIFTAPILQLNVWGHAGTR